MFKNNYYDYKNINRKEYVPINLSVIQRLIEAHKVDKFDMETYKKYGLASKNNLINFIFNKLHIILQSNVW